MYRLIHLLPIHQSRCSGCLFTAYVLCSLPVHQLPRQRFKWFSFCVFPVSPRLVSAFFHSPRDLACQQVLLSLVRNLHELPWQRSSDKSMVLRLQQKRLLRPWLCSGQEWSGPHNVSPVGPKSMRLPGNRRCVPQRASLVLPSRRQYII